MYAHTAELPTVSAPTTGRRNDTRSTSLVVVALSLVSLLCATTAWRVSEAKRVPRVEPSRPGVVASLDRRRSHNGRYHAEVVAATSLSTGEPQRWIVRLTRRDHRRLAGAKVTARAWMPESGERSPVSATTSYLGGGRYLVDGVYFSRPGWWNVALVVNGRAWMDSVAFNVVVR